MFKKKNILLAWRALSVFMVLTLPLSTMPGIGADFVYAGQPEQEKIIICHATGNNGGYVEVEVDKDGWDEHTSAHSDHSGDFAKVGENCVPPDEENPECGNNIKEAGEQCDGTDGLQDLEDAEYYYCSNTCELEHTTIVVCHEEEDGSFTEYEVDEYGFDHGWEYDHGNHGDFEKTGDSCEPEEEPITVLAYKVVCESEADLPNWGTEGNPNGAPAKITANTAADYVAASNGKCELVPDWNFQWGINGQNQAGDLIGPASAQAGWSNFDSATADNGTEAASVEITDFVGPGLIWFREVLQEGYVPFSSMPENQKQNNVSAEFYCDTDILNYDNWEWISSPQAGQTYYCVAFNAVAEDAPVCGDGVKEGNEVCDDGQLNGQPNKCNLECTGTTTPVCGNNVEEAGEQCDDGAQGSDTCTAQCTDIVIHPPVCGDGVKEGNEVCDDGQLNGQPNKCNLECTGTTTPVCGNESIEAGEQCDDGNTENNDGCSNQCQNEDTLVCGYKYYDENENGLLDEGEDGLEDWTINLIQFNACEAGEEWADGFQDFNQGLTKNNSSVVASRSDANKALGAAQGNDTENFVSLGFGGSIVLTFNNYIVNQPGDDIQVTETTYGNQTCGNYQEKAIVYASQNGTTWFELGDICQDGSLDLGSELSWAKYLKFQDISNRLNFTAAEADGFDIDGVKALNCASSITEVATTNTDETGHYCFEGIEAGDYRIEEEMQTNWLPTAPAFFDISLEYANPLGINFFNFIEGVDEGSIFGFKYHDLDGDGAFNNQDVGLEGWTIWASNGNQTFTADTNESGEYGFSGLNAGEWTVWEIFQDEPNGWWINTTDATTTVQLAQNVGAGPVSFGNLMCIDEDGDNYSVTGLQCGTPVDCNDTNASINPAATEVCDQVDNNCDGNIDEGGVCGGGDEPQCSDSADNDEDGLTDIDDPQCHTDGNPENPESYDPEIDNEFSACNDGQDNDGDGRIDSTDPACHTDRDSSNSESYDPTINSEADTQCSDLADNDEDGLTDINDPACHADFDSGNPDSYDPADDNESDDTACSDGVDNDEDGRTDAEDPACHTDRNPNDEDDTYDPSINTEADTQCSDGVDNDGNEDADANDPDCHTDGNAENPDSYNPNDNDESSAPQPVCTDNDGDGFAQEGGQCGTVDCNDSAFSSNNTCGGGGGGGGGGPTPLIIHTEIAGGHGANGTFTATITWFTNKPATTRVVYDDEPHAILGSAPNYGYQWSTTVADLDPKVTFHTVVIEGLDYAKTYYFRPISAASPEVYGIELQLTTGDAPTPPTSTPPTTPPTTPPATPPTGGPTPTPTPTPTPIPTPPTEETGTIAGVEFVEATTTPEVIEEAMEEPVEEVIEESVTTATERDCTVYIWILLILNIIALAYAAYRSRLVENKKLKNMWWILAILVVVPVIFGYAACWLVIWLLIMLIAEVILISTLSKKQADEEVKANS